MAGMHRYDQLEHWTRCFGSYQNKTTFGLIIDYLKGTLRYPIVFKGIASELRPRLHHDVVSLVKHKGTRPGYVYVQTLSSTIVGILSLIKYPKRARILTTESTPIFSTPHTKLIYKSRD